MSARNAEADLAKLQDEAAKLRVQREAIDRKIADNEEEARKIVAYLELHRKYDTIAPSGGVSTPEIVGQSGGGHRRAYGTLKRAVLGVVEILRETGKPWHTRDLVPELERRGIPVTGSDPVTNLSNKLGRSGLLRSHRIFGWHLTDWPDFVDPVEERLADLRAQARRASKVPDEASAPLASDSLSRDQFQGKGIPEAAVLVLSKLGRAAGNVEIARLMDAADFPFTTKDHSVAVEGGLKRRAKSPGDVARVAPGTWGLVKWYNPAQLEGFRKVLGGMPGRDVNDHLKKTRAAVDLARSRGVRFGRKNKLSDEEMENARVLLSEGSRPADVAKVFGVSTASVLKWIKKWAALQMHTESD